MRKIKQILCELGFHRWNHYTFIYNGTGPSPKDRGECIGGEKECRWCGASVFARVRPKY